MSALEWAASVVGAGIGVLVVADVFLTVLHMDRDGPLARFVMKAIWRVSVHAARLAPTGGITIRGLAGPLAIAAIFVAWTALFVLAFALIYWPHLGAFAADEPIEGLGLSSALYFSGNVTTVLGLGDITPLRVPLQILTVVQAGLGFGVFTAGVTYLVNVILSAGRRNALTQRLWVESRGTGDGVEALLVQLESEEVGSVHARLRTLVTALYEVEEQLRRLPVIDLLYRSGSRAHPSELMLRSSGTLAIAAGLLGDAPNAPTKGLAVVARELGDVVTMIMRNATAEWFEPDVLARFDRAEASDGDRRWMAETRTRLAERVPVTTDVSISPESVRASEASGEPWLHLRARLRIFLDEARERMIWIA